MKTRTNQPVFLDNGNLVDDNNLGGGTKLYLHTLVIGGMGGNCTIKFMAPIGDKLTASNKADFLPYVKPQCDCLFNNNKVIAVVYVSSTFNIIVLTSSNALQTNVMASIVSDDVVAL